METYHGLHLEFLQLHLVGQGHHQLHNGVDLGAEPWHHCPLTVLILVLHKLLEIVQLVRTVVDLELIGKSNFPAMLYYIIIGAVVTYKTFGTFSMRWWCEVSSSTVS